MLPTILRLPAIKSASGYREAQSTDVSIKVFGLGLVALRWLGVEMRQIWLPLAVSNAVFAVTYYAMLWFGLAQITKL